MPILRGFVTQTGYISNTPDTVGEFLELSPIALTFARERGEYQDADLHGFVLHTFVSLDDSAAKRVVTAIEVQTALSLVKYVLSYMSQAAFPYDRTQFKQAVEAEFTGKLKTFDFGPFHVGSGITLPEFITCTLLGTNTDLKLWLRNEAFENQYSDFEIVPVPPLDLLDRFFGTYGDLATLIKATPLSDTMERINVYKDGAPETAIRIAEYDYINPNNTAQTTTVRWPAIVYGALGDNVDSIQDALIHYVLEHSTHTQAQWEIIFPDLFKRNEFLFYPRWDKVAIPNLTELSALYSSASDPVETLTFAKTVWSNIPSSWIEANLTLFPFDYKGVSVLGMNGTTNKVGKQKLSTLFPDYLPVSTSSLDFNRMTIYTREWIIMMVGLLKVAETTDEYSTVEAPMHKLKRNNRLYVAQQYDGVNYLVACASNEEG